MRTLILASTSPFRRELLGRLGLPFQVAEPSYREEQLSHLTPGELALHHAVGKARSVARSHPEAVVIGADQVAELDGTILGKPGTVAAATDQLRRMAGKQVAFWTGLAVVCAGTERSTLEGYRVRLRHLSAAEIGAYVAAERPLQSAGSFQIEGLGIALMEELEGRDYTSLIGLPLIALTDLLAQCGVRVLPTGAAAE